MSRVSPVFPVLIWLILLSGCATTPPPQNPRVEVQLVEANQMLDSLNEETQSYYTDVAAVRHDTAALTTHPGWPEMRSFIEEMPESEGNADAARMARETKRWSKRWGMPWGEMFARYMDLVKRCSGLEARRIGLQSRLLAAQARFLGVAAMEYADGRIEEGESMEAIVAVLTRSAEELDTYSVNELGLYD